MSLVLAPRPPYIVARLPGNLLAAKYRRRCADRFCWSREVVTLVHRKFSHLQQLSMKLEARFRCLVARHAICTRSPLVLLSVARVQLKVEDMLGVSSEKNQD
jgi:hypothetical protein